MVFISLVGCYCEYCEVVAVMCLSHEGPEDRETETCGRTDGAHLADGERHGGTQGKRHR